MKEGEASNPPESRVCGGCPAFHRNDCPKSRGSSPIAVVGFGATPGQFQLEARRARSRSQQAKKYPTNLRYGSDPQCGWSLEPRTLRIWLGADREIALGIHTRAKPDVLPSAGRSAKLEMSSDRSDSILAGDRNCFHVNDNSVDLCVYMYVGMGRSASFSARRLNSGSVRFNIVGR